MPADTDILIQATCVGLYPNVEDTPDIVYTTIKEYMTACDVVFNPPDTLFLQKAAKRGAGTVNGLGMLAEQGAVNFTLWTGEEAPVTIMEETLRKEFGV